MINELAVATGIAPSVLWDEHPTDLATMLAVVREMGER